MANQSDSPAVIFGVDFTSAPSRRKSITCASCELYGSQLVVRDFLLWSSFVEFERWLLTPGPWVAALDFPFSLPRIFLQRVHWPLSWPECIAYLSTLDKGQFAAILDSYRASRPAGDKLHLRVADRLAGAISPMMMHRVPVGKMFFAGATRLLAAGVCVPPCLVHKDTRVALEGYPSLVARHFIGRQSYKSDERQKQTPALLAARRALLDALCSPDLASSPYGLSLSLSHKHAEMLLAEPMGDLLDALLSAIQAAWASGLRTENYGIPPEHTLEGWIVDPLLRPFYDHAQDAEHSDGDADNGAN